MLEKQTRTLLIKYSASGMVGINQNRVKILREKNGGHKMQ